MSDVADALRIVRDIAIGIGTLGIGVPLVWRWGLNAYDAIRSRVVAYHQDNLTLEHLRDRNAINRVKIIERDENGNLGVALNTDGTYRNLDTGEVFTQLTTLYLDPMRMKIDAMHKMLLAMRGIQGPGKAMETLSETTETPIAWPATVTLGDLFRDRRPSIHDLVVGAYPTENGLQVISDSLHNLMHVLTVGASGWGKSTWLRAFLWQIAKATEPCEVIAVDVNGSEFNVLRGWGKLRYPVARDVPEAVALLGAVSGEIADRKRLYESYAPIATTLNEYNEATGANVAPWVVVVDEGTSLLNQPGISEPLRAAVQTARQYGIYILLAGQSANHSVINTQTRDQFSTRLCFHTSPISSRVILDDSGAGSLAVKGRALCQMVGRELCELQGPFIDREAFMRALGNGGPKLAMPVIEGPSLERPRLADDPENINQVLALHRAGESDTAIARQVFGHGTTFYIGIVREILEQHNNSHDNESPSVGHNNSPAGDLRYVVEPENGQSSTTTTSDTPTDTPEDNDQVVVGPDSEEPGWCEFCEGGLGRTFGICTHCGVAVCSVCAPTGLCPDCRAAFAGKTAKERS